MFEASQQGHTAAGVNVMLMNGVSVDVLNGMELYPLLERISAEVSSPTYLCNIHIIHVSICTVVHSDDHS